MKNNNSQSTSSTANYKPYRLPCKKCGHVQARPTRAKYICSYCKQQDQYIWGWKTLRQKVLERDGACVVCGRSDTKLHVHHVDRNKKNNEMKNLQTKCYQCHQSNHMKEGYSIRDIEYGSLGVRIRYRKNKSILETVRSFVQSVVS